MLIKSLQRTGHVLLNILLMFALITGTAAPAAAQSFSDIMGSGKGSAESEARKFTADKRQAAIAAKTLFERASINSQTPVQSSISLPDGEVYNPQNPARAAELRTELDAATAAYEEAEYLESRIGEPIPSAVLERLEKAVSPFVLFLNKLPGTQPQAIANTLTVNPGQVKEFNLSAYCMDSNLGSPKFGETFQLRPAAQFAPPEIAPVLASMMRSPATHDSHTQSIVWALRNAYKNKTPIKLDDSSLAKMEAVHPGAGEAISRYNGKMETAKLVRGLVNRLLPQAQQLVSQIQNLDPRQIIAETQAQLAALDQMPVAGNIEELAAYTTISPGVAARTTSPSGGARSVQVQIVNTTSQTYTFKPYEWAAVSPRGSQQLALQIPEGMVEGGGSSNGLGLADLASFGLDMSVLGNIKSAIQALTGRDLITGAETSRWVELAGIIPVFGGGIKLVAKEGKIAKLAAREGKTVEAISARRQVAEDFYKLNGWSIGSARQHMTGINLDMPVEVVTIPKGTKMYQWQVPGRETGDYFSNSHATPSQLGISPLGSRAGYPGSTHITEKVQTEYVAKTDIQALRSTASKTDDTWSHGGGVAETTGGGLQYFSPIKDSFMRSGK